MMSGSGGDEIDLRDDNEPETPPHSSNNYNEEQSSFHTPEEDDKGNKIAESSESKATLMATSVTTVAEPQNVKTTTTAASAKSDQKSDATSDHILEITVGEPNKIGEGMSSYVVYKITTKTNLPYFRKNIFSVNRRFSDFLGLRDKLAEKHVHLGRIVPPAPDKDAVGTAKVKMSKDENLSSADFIEKRRSALDRFINRTAAHPVLRTDPDFREFLELDTDLPRATNTSALSGAGVRRLFNRVGDTVNKMTFKMDESDPWFEEKQNQIESLDQQLRKLSASVDALVHHRKELTSTTGAFAKSAAMLGNSEEHTSLSCALSQLAETEEKIEQLYSQQVNHDSYYLGELLKDYIALIGAIKDVFHQRVKVFQTWQHSQQMLVKKREQKVKLELAGKTDKIPQANEEVVEWESKVNRGQEEFENITKTIKVEVEKFELNRIRDFKASIIKYMEHLLENQQQLIKYWEAFLPEAKAIA
ncbi:Sorting nexin-2-like protein [Dinothrombium tinctorium]|uniref:Sorting nexin-2 n=1 Tax=Dinothrombium tinctorium TaxID=1965070 RepID=A0A443RPM7_9ACAR|nr:Sorting nexin-2-like protein [Dinothrombium tinctorium]